MNLYSSYWMQKSLPFKACKALSTVGQEGTVEADIWFSEEDVGKMSTKYERIFMTEQ